MSSTTERSERRAIATCTERGITYRLSEPWHIGSNLKPTVRFDDEANDTAATLSLWAHTIGADGVTYAYEIRERSSRNVDSPGRWRTVDEGTDLRCPMHSGVDLDDALATMCTFLLSWAQEYADTKRHGSVEELQGLASYYEWAYTWASELEWLRSEIDKEEEDS